MKSNLSSPSRKFWKLVSSCIVKRAPVTHCRIGIDQHLSIFSPPRLSSPELRQARRRKNALRLARLSPSPADTRPTSHHKPAASLAGSKPTRWLAATFYPCPAGRVFGTPESVFALKRSSKPGPEPTHLTGGARRSQVQSRSARTRPRCDVAAVAPVWLRASTF